MFPYRGGRGGFNGFSPGNARFPAMNMQFSGYGAFNNQGMRPFMQNNFSPMGNNMNMGRGGMGNRGGRGWGYTDGGRGRGHFNRGNHNGPSGSRDVSGSSASSSKSTSEGTKETPEVKKETPSASKEADQGSENTAEKDSTVVADKDGKKVESEAHSTSSTETSNQTTVQVGF